MLIVLGTGALGAGLVKWQGLTVLRRIQHELTEARLPGAALFDGLLVLIAGVMLLTPGFLTDLLGLALLVPVVRRVIRRLLWRGVTAALGTGPLKSI